MKTVVAIGMLVLALSLCNLMGRRRSANNSNSNTSGTETTLAENANAPVLEQAPPPPGVRTLNANQNSAASEPPPPAPRPSNPKAPISGGVLNGRAIRLVQPPYPQIAKSAHASGQVTVRITIDEDGNVISASAVSGHPLLQAASVAAARASKFTPTKLGGQPVKVTGVVIYNFVEQ